MISGEVQSLRNESNNEKQFKVFVRPERDMRISLSALFLRFNKNGLNQTNESCLLFVTFCA